MRSPFLSLVTRSRIGTETRTIVRCYAKDPAGARSGTILASENLHSSIRPISRTTKKRIAEAILFFVVGDP